MEGGDDRDRDGEGGGDGRETYEYVEGTEMRGVK